MSKERYVNVTDARKQLFDIVEETQTSPLPVHLTVRGVPAAVIVSQEEYDSWMATLETLSDPELMEGIKEADQELGEVISLDEVKKELGISLEKVKHAVSGKSKKQSPKRP